MNGLPRHVGQARALATLLDVRHVLLLECSPQVVLARIAANTGGDRAHRTDDDVRAIAQTLAIYAARTQPLVDFYASAGAERHAVAVTATLSVVEMWDLLQDH